MSCEGKNCKWCKAWDWLVLCFMAFVITWLFFLLGFLTAEMITR